MWQVCPVCKGSIYYSTSDGSIGNCESCFVCKGKGIINEVTGLPPKDTEQTSKPLITYPNAYAPYLDCGISIPYQVDMIASTPTSSEIPDRKKYVNRHVSPISKTVYYTK